MTGDHTLDTRFGEPDETGLSPDASRDIGAAMKSLLVNAFDLYLMAKNSHWHMSGPHFIDCHLLLDEHGMQAFAMIDPIAERSGQLDGTKLRLIEENAQAQSPSDSKEAYADPQDMLADPRKDSRRLAKAMRQTHKPGDESKDVTISSGFEVWIDETECRARFRYKTSRYPPRSHR